MFQILSKISHQDCVKCFFFQGILQNIIRYSIDYYFNTYRAIYLENLPWLPQKLESFFMSSSGVLTESLSEFTRGFFFRNVFRIFKGISSTIKKKEMFIEKILEYFVRKFSFQRESWEELLESFLKVSFLDFQEFWLKYLKIFGKTISKKILRNQWKHRLLVDFIKTSQTEILEEFLTKPIKKSLHKLLEDWIFLRIFWNKVWKNSWKS